MSFEITTIKAFIAVDPNDQEEGIIGAHMPDGTWMPLICADDLRVSLLRPLAQEIVRRTGVHVTLAEFSVRKNLETIRPGVDGG